MIKDIFDDISYIFGYGYKVKIMDATHYSTEYEVRRLDLKYKEWLETSISGKYSWRMSVKQNPKMYLNKWRRLFERPYRYKSSREVTFSFSKKSDAILFKLVCG